MATFISFVDDAECRPLPPAVVVVDDEPCIVDLLTEILHDRYRCLSALSASEALALLETNDVAVVLSDVRMDGMTGIEMLPAIERISPNTVPVIVSGEQAIDTAIDALKVGAFDFLRKPFGVSDVLNTVECAMEKYRNNLKKQAEDAQIQELVVGQQGQLDLLRYFDPVTGLANRELFRDRVSSAIDASSKNRDSAIVLLAIERFRNLTESLGASATSKMLQDLTQRWLEFVPEAATLARFENDEFGLFVPFIASSADALEVVRGLRDAVRDPFLINQNEIAISINAGIGIFPNDGRTAIELEQAAALALSNAKLASCGAIKFHEPDMSSDAHRRLAIECGLRRALKKDEIENYYQPKLNFITGKVTGMEALVRWNSPDFGYVPASEIIEVAESTGLAKALGLRVLENACRATKRLALAGYHLKVAVNISGQQLADAWFPDAVDTTLKSTGLDPFALELEITESSLVQNATVAADLLRQIRDLGVSIAIDDFGTGFSSLSYLSKFPLDTLKIDRSFVSEITEHAGGAEFISAIVSLAEKLNLRTVVEGVETTEQLDLLRCSGCVEWQGYLCSEPLPFDKFYELVRSGQVSSDREVYSELALSL